MTTQDNLQEADGILDEQNNNEQETPPEQKSIPDESTGTGAVQAESKNEAAEPAQPKSVEKPITKLEQTPLEDTKEGQSQEIENVEIEEKKEINYETYTLEDLVSDFERLLKNDDLYSIRPKVNSIKNIFNEKFSAKLNEKKEAFLAEGGNSIDFSFDSPVKKEFNRLSRLFREKNEEYQKKKTQNLKQNLETRLRIIEDIKGLIDVSQSSNTTYNKFKDLQEEWRKLGKVPAKEANNVWNNYRHHVEKFYDFLHLNRDLRDRDYQHNLEKKQKLIKSAEALASEENLGRAFRELQALHKIWKEELGPVAKEYREVLWEQFSAVTKVINDKRQVYNEQIEQELMLNFEAKQVIIAKIKEIFSAQNNTHNEWQKGVKEVEALREEFFKIGSVPRKLRNQSWTDFKTTVRNFNKTKNNFYKELKKSQSENLKKKKELVDIAVQNKDNEDLETTVVLMKNIQNQWKKTGHVSRKDSQKLWKEFRAACNHFFDRYHEQKNTGTPEENEAFTQKEQLFEKLKSFRSGEDKDADLEILKDFSKQWNAIGRVPRNKRNIDRDFFKKLSKLFEDIGVNEEELKALKYTNKIQELSKDPKALNNEISYVRKKIDEIKSEMNQLENNLQFFSNVEDDNPMVVDVHKKIEKHKNQLEQWTRKLSNIKKTLN
jgi:hypothetical protein